MIRNHLRTHAIGYVAIFIALTGTAVAANTVRSEDIVNGQVMTEDISNANGVRSVDVRDDTFAEGGLEAVDLAPESVGSSEILDGTVGEPELDADSVGSSQILADAVGVAELATDAVSGGEILTSAVNASEIATDAVRGDEIRTNSIDTTDLNFDSVTKPDLDDDAVGAASIVELHEHVGTIEPIEDATAHDGAWQDNTGSVSCPSTEKLLTVSLDWIDNNNHNETIVARGPTIDRSGDDSATIVGAFDGGGGAANPAAFQVVATCFGP
jgi:hypothetical protein